MHETILKTLGGSIQKQIGNGSRDAESAQRNEKGSIYQAKRSQTWSAHIRTRAAIRQGMNATQKQKAGISTGFLWFERQ